MKETATRSEWSNRLSAYRDSIRGPETKAIEALLSDTAPCRWSTLITLMQSLPVDWSTFKPLPLDPCRDVKTHHLIHCATDEQGARLCELLKEGEKTLHPNCDGKAGYYSTAAQLTSKLALHAPIPKGYHILPAHMFL